MPQMCPNCSHNNPDDAQTCSNCSAPLRGLLGENIMLADRYKTVSVLGCGAMGAVYLADDTRLVGRRCAIKENRPDSSAKTDFLARARAQFMAETSVLARLDHSSLPKVSDYFIEDGREYLVMDYVEGEDLESTLQRTQHPLPEASVLAWTEQVLDALVYLHNQRPQPIIHRDIKPANIRINIQGKAKLVDFGLVKMLDASNPETKFELRGIGTPAYAPLEQFASSAEHTDARSDIYALGATMYHLLTNEYPPDVHQRILNPEILIPPRQLNSELSEKTEQIVLKAMNIYPVDRFQTAEAMRETLLTPAGAPLPGAKPARTPPHRKSVVPLWLAGLAGLALVLLILGGVTFTLFGGRDQNIATTELAAVVEGQPVSTATPLILQALADAPTDTPSPTEPPPAAVEETSGVEEETVAPTPTATPEPTTTPAAQAAQAQGIPESSLVGTIAYPVFNGTDYNIYFGQADGSGSQLFRESASQPTFSPDGSRIAFHSWRLDAWGLITMDLSGDNFTVVANFVEDQLPTWSVDGSEIVLLSRRAGDRKSRLIRVGSHQNRTEGVVIGEGEYPTIGPDNQLAFRGWGSTAPGLRLATTSLQNIRVVTESEDDTAPAISPDGEQIAFMSRRDGNWEIYLIKVDGSGLERLTNDPAEDGLPTWSPDGKVLAFVSSRGGAWAIWATTPDGSDQRQLFSMQGSPDGFVGTDFNASRGWAEERISWKR